MLYNKCHVKFTTNNELSIANFFLFLQHKKNRVKQKKSILHGLKKERKYKYCKKIIGCKKLLKKLQRNKYKKYIVEIGIF